MPLADWIAALKKDLGDYGFFLATQIIDLHSTWKTGAPVSAIVLLITELCPVAFTATEDSVISKPNDRGAE